MASRQSTLKEWFLKTEKKEYFDASSTACELVRATGICSHYMKHSKMEDTKMQCICWCCVTAVNYDLCHMKDGKYQLGSYNDKCECDDCRDVRRLGRNAQLAADEDTETDSNQDPEEVESDQESVSRFLDLDAAED